MDQEQKIKLPVSVLSGLFSNSLVDVSTGKSIAQQPLAQEDSVNEIIAVGTLVVADANGKQLAQQQHDFLDAIMKACKLEKKNYRVLTNNEPQCSDFQSMHNQFKHAELLLFGVEPSSIGLPIHFPHFQVQSFQKVKYLSAPALEKIEADKGLKMQLWQCLKQLFPG